MIEIGNVDVHAY